MYHLPIVDHWRQAGSLYSPDALAWSVPGNNELVTLWLVGPFKGDFFYSLTNLPAAILLACGTVEIGRHLGLSSTWRNLGGLAVVSNAVVITQLRDVENDVAVAGVFLVCLGYLLRYADHCRLGDLLLGITCLGLLAGIKFYALGYAAVAAVVGVLLITSRHGGRTALRATGAGLLGVLIFGGYWYIRNWIVGGSPLYPLGLTATKDDLGQVYPGSIWATTFFGNGSPELPKLGLKAVWGSAGYCQFVALLALPVSLTWLVISSHLRARRTDPGRAYEARVDLAVATTAAGLVLGVTPFAVESVPGTLNQLHLQYCPVRYGLCFLSLATLALIVVLHDLSRGAWEIASRVSASTLPGSGVSVARALAWAVIPVLTTLLICGQLLVTRQEVPGIDDSLSIGTGLLGLANLIIIALFTERRILAVIVCLGGVLGCAAGTGWASEKWQVRYAPFYDERLGQGMFERMSRELPADTLLCVLDHRAYPFFGPARQFRICQPYRIKSDAWWYQYLHDHNIRLVVYRHDASYEGQSWQATWTWMESHPDVFERLDWADEFSVYRVNQDAINRVAGKSE
jgi:hypothetical protein